MRRPRAGLALGVVFALATVATLLVLGRSQIGAQAPTAGGSLLATRAAGIDLLLRQEVPIGVAPSCAAEGELVVCLGTRADGAPIRFVAPLAGDPALVTVTVDGRGVAEAPVDDVLDDAGSR